MFLLIILFGLAALGLAFALYLQADMQQKPLLPVAPPVVNVSSPAPVAAQSDTASAVSPSDDSATGTADAGASAQPAGDSAQQTTN